MGLIRVKSNLQNNIILTHIKLVLKFIFQDKYFLILLFVNLSDNKVHYKREEEGGRYWWDVVEKGTKGK